MPIAEHRERLKCGMVVVDLASGRLLGQFEFKEGVEELFDVVVLPGTDQIALRGPYADAEGEATIWTVPAPTESPAKPAGFG